MVLNMNELKAKLIQIVKLDIHGFMTDYSAVRVKEVLESDYAVCMVPGEEYDAILVSSPLYPVEVGKRSAGWVFSDKKERFPDGHFIDIGTTQTIAEPIDGLKLLSTKRTVYLVI